MPHEESAIDASRLHRHSETARKQFAFSQLQRAGLGKTFTGARWERRTETCHGFGEIRKRHGEEGRTKAVVSLGPADKKLSISITITKVKI